MKYIIITILALIATPIYADTAHIRPNASIEAVKDWSYEFTKEPSGYIYIGSTTISVYELTDMPRGISAFYEKEQNAIAVRMLTASDEDILHESVHAAYYVLQEQGYGNFDTHYNQELLAYTVADTVRQIKEVLTKQFFLCKAQF